MKGQVAICWVINLDSSHLFLLIDFILLMNFGSKSVKNLIDSSLEQVSGLIGSLLDCFLNTITNIALLVFELFVLKGISIGLLKIKDTKFFEVFTSISMLQQDLAENWVGHEQLTFKIGCDCLPFSWKYVESPHSHYLPRSELFEEFLLADLIELCQFGEPILNLAELNRLIVQKGGNSLFR